jgi:hypothetical protein
MLHNQPGDKLLDASDLVITVGYDPIEYDAALGNSRRKGNVIHTGTTYTYAYGERTPGQKRSHQRNSDGAGRTIRIR